MIIKAHKWLGKVRVSYLLHCKWISLLMVQVLLQVEESVKEYMSHPAALQVSQRDLTCREIQKMILRSRTD